MTYKHILKGIAGIELDGWSVGTQLSDVSLSTVKALSASLKALRKETGKVAKTSERWSLALEATVDMRMASDISLASVEAVITAIEDATVAEMFQDPFEGVFGKHVDDVYENLLEKRYEIATKRNAVIKLERELHKIAGLEVPAYLTTEDVFLN
jgi:hypothetical protein